jgi:hypothetical protein
MNKIIILIILLGISSLLSATIWEIKQDGTGDFVTIQEGIDASADGDTVLVHPGTYYENIDFSGKTIVVASLCLTTGDESYKYETIIDGDQSGSCVRVASGEEEGTMLCGFTLTNGSGLPLYPGDSANNGGGVFVHESQITISNCIITRNFVSNAGGGIFASISTIYLEGNSIFDNRARVSGGGIFISSGGAIGSPSYIYWDEENLNSVYLNYGGLSGIDILMFEGAGNSLNVVVDTFTVSEPDTYFIALQDDFGQYIENVNLSANHAIIEEHIDADLYVVADGDNNNSGLTPDDPLATINYALSLIKPDSLNNNTVYVADGVYSLSENDNWFPLSMRSYISLEGESMQNTILDAEHLHNSAFIYGRNTNYNNYIKNFTMKNGKRISSVGLIFLFDSFFNPRYHTITLENITVSNSRVKYYGIYTSVLGINMKNVNYLDSYGGVAFRFHDNRISPQQVTIENSIISGTRTWYGANGGNFAIITEAKPCNDVRFPVSLINVEISDIFNPGNPAWPYATSGINVYRTVQLDLINCTLSDLRGYGTIGSIRVNGTNAEINIYNSVLWNPMNNYEMILLAESDCPNTVNVSHSILRDGEDGIYNQGNHHTINWLEGNLDEDPLWVGEGDYPYSLSANSPAINAGTLDLPLGVVLPETDLAGNPRIYGDSIDMGAYEWQGVDAEDDMVMKINQTRISNYPNPFNPDTTIRLELAEAGRIELSIYNIKGQKVRNLLDAHTEPGIFTCNWNGRDDNGRPVSSGQYFIKLKQNDEVTVEKMMMVK